MIFLLFISSNKQAWVTTPTNYKSNNNHLKNINKKKKRKTKTNFPSYSHSTQVEQLAHPNPLPAHPTIHSHLPTCLPSFSPCLPNYPTYLPNIQLPPVPKQDGWFSGDEPELKCIRLCETFLLCFYGTRVGIGGWKVRWGSVVSLGRAGKPRTSAWERKRQQMASLFTSQNHWSDSWWSSGSRVAVRGAVYASLPTLNRISTLGQLFPKPGTHVSSPICSLPVFPSPWHRRFMDEGKPNDVGKFKSGRVRGNRLKTKRMSPSPINTHTHKGAEGECCQNAMTEANGGRWR